ncbi:MAG: PilW family protein [Nitrospirota bacterium]
MTKNMRQRNRCVEAGFSLIELMIVLAIFGVVVGAINTLYVAHQRSATVEGEVVDVQQNLRIAMDQITRDISMAGFALKGIQVGGVDVNPVNAVTNNASPTADMLTINTAGESIVVSTIDNSVGEVNLAAGALLNLSVRVIAGTVGGFEQSDEGASKVRIVNLNGEPVAPTAPATDMVFTVVQVNPDTDPCGAVPAPCLQLRADVAGTGTVEKGDNIIRTNVVGGAEDFPHTVRYSVAACPAPLAGNCLMRTLTPAPLGGAQVVATNISDVQFRYLLSGTTEVDAPTAAQMSSIRAIRVTISGQVVDTAAAAGGNLKTRTLMSVAAIRNASIP